MSLTCSDLQSLGSSGLSSLTTTQISNLADQEFIDCADLLGTPSDYSDDQKEALATVAKRSTVYTAFVIIENCDKEVKPRGSKV